MVHDIPSYEGRTQQRPTFQALLAHLWLEQIIRGEGWRVCIQTVPQTFECHSLLHSALTTGFIYETGINKPPTTTHFGWGFQNSQKTEMHGGNSGGLLHYIQQTIVHYTTDYKDRDVIHNKFDQPVKSLIRGWCFTFNRVCML